jgi:ABC-type antimicrobial peptide transport system permease subunit
VAIVSRLFAAQAWPGQSPLGRCVIVSDGPCSAVVGVAGDTHRQRLRESPVAHVYVPAGQETGFGGDVLLVRGAGDLAAAATVVRERIAALDPSVTSVRTESLRTRIDPQMHAWRMGATVFAFAGVLALVIAAAGVYSVLAYVVVARRRDIGIRLALGAQVAQVGGVVVWSGLRLVVIGISLGLAAAWALSPRLESMLFDVGPHDPLVYATVAGVLGTVAIVASLAPALRAARLDPLVVLRGE